MLDNASSGKERAGMVLDFLLVELNKQENKGMHLDISPHECSGVYISINRQRRGPATLKLKIQLCSEFRRW